ncbi:acrEF/envCD operon transcriptional regulator [Citrobacter tructae]|uniref:acrEF/envCD operon transcriptional regulator n=1 Tax=Citrobacter tructae TaxID=2562449 RepID=UPI003F54569A
MAKKTKADALKTRQHLIETAIMQFATKGVGNTTLNDIADAAQVTRGAIYWHFENKTQLFNEVWLQQPPLGDLINDRLSSDTHDNPLLQLREKLIVGLQYIATVPRQQALLQILYHKCEFNDEMISTREIREKMGFSQLTLRHVLQTSMNKGLVSRTLDLEMILIVIHGSFSGVVKNWLMNPASFDLFSQAPVLVDNVLRMLTPEGNVMQFIQRNNIVRETE